MNDAYKQHCKNDAIGFGQIFALSLVGALALSGLILKGSGINDAPQADAGSVQMVEMTLIESRENTTQFFTNLGQVSAAQCKGIANALHRNGGGGVAFVDSHYGHAVPFVEVMCNDGFDQ